MSRILAPCNVCDQGSRYVVLSHSRCMSGLPNAGTRYAVQTKASRPWRAGAQGTWRSPVGWTARCAESSVASLSRHGVVEREHTVRPPDEPCATMPGANEIDC